MHFNPRQVSPLIFRYFKNYDCLLWYSLKLIRTFLINRQVRCAIACKTLSELEDSWRHFDVIGIDEGQFFDDVSKNSQNIFVSHELRKNQTIFVGRPGVIEI